jgi:cytoskeletal protein RodZ
MSLDDVARATKISHRILQHIEANRFACLPLGIVTKGYLRAYATSVGLDGEQIVREYIGQRFGAAGEKLPIARVLRVERDRSARQLGFLVGEVSAIVLAVVVYSSFVRSDGPLRPGPAGVAMRSSPPGATAVPERIHDVSPAPSGAGLKAEEEEQGGLRLEIQANGPCWVSATADDRRVLRRLLVVGDREIITAKEHVVLHVGDPGTFVYRLNGAPGRRLGPAATPVIVRITDANYETFLVG